MSSQSISDTTASDKMGFGENVIASTELEKTEPLSETSDPPAFVRPIQQVPIYKCHHGTVNHRHLVRCVSPLIMSNWNALLTKVLLP